MHESEDSTVGALTGYTASREYSSHIQTFLVLTRNRWGNPISLDYYDKMTTN